MENGKKYSILGHLEFLIFFLFAVGQRGLMDRLRILVTTTMRNADCRQHLTTFQRSYVLNDTICTENEPRQGLSWGDYGTGLISAENGRMLGIASVFMFAADGGTPDIFTRIQPYLEWIQQTMAGNVSRN